MQPTRVAANRLLAATCFWLTPLIAITFYYAITLLLLHASAYFGPIGTLVFVFIVTAIISTANAIGFLAAAHLAPRVSRHNAFRLYLLSAVLGFACYYTYPLVQLVMPVVESPAIVLLHALALLVLSSIINLVVLRIALAIRLLHPLVITLVCTQCGYDLRGSSTSRCPECGSQRRPLSPPTS